MRCGFANRTAALKGMSKEGSISGLNQEAADMRHGGAQNKALQVVLL